MALPWLRVWSLALLIFGTSISGLEAYVRGRGYRPTAPDNSKELWYFWRQQVCRDDGKVIVLLGTSRMAADVSLNTMRECLPGVSVVQLALSGMISPVGVLRDLVGDPAFTGTIVCDLDTPFLEQSRWQGHQEFRRYYPTSWCDYFDSLAKIWIDSRLAFCGEPFRLKRMAPALLGHPMPEPDHCQIGFDRQMRWDFSSVSDLNRVRQSALEHARDEYRALKLADPATLAEDVRELDRACDSFRQRGGRIVYLRLPSSGDRWELEERYHARHHNWDRVQIGSAVTWIHFADVPGMRSLTCPDESHLDCRDGPQFTRLLVNELQKRGVVP